MAVTLWKITGEAANDSSGGNMVVYVFSEDDHVLPDTKAALAEAAPQYSWYQIDSIVRVGEFPSAWHEDDVQARPLTLFVTGLDP